MGVELDLAWAVEEYEGVICKLIQLVYQPVNVLNEMLHAVD